MNLLSKTLLTVVIIVALVPVIGLLLPKAYSVPREIVINATPDQIFKFINNPSNRKAWSPFYSPAVTNRFEGPKAGVGAVMHWAAGQSSGRIEITESNPESSVEYNTYFDNGYPTSTSRFTFEPVEGQATRVKWDFWGDVPFHPLKRFYIFQIDKKTGGKHLDGLVKLKEVVESQSI